MREGPVPRPAVNGFWRVVEAVPDVPGRSELLVPEKAVGGFRVDVNPDVPPEGGPG